MPLRSAARRWKTRRARWSARCRSGLRRWCCIRASGRISAAIVTGVNQYGTFVRTLDPHVDGMLVHGGHGLDVGDRADGEADLDRSAAGIY